MRFTAFRVTLLLMLGVGTVIVTNQAIGVMRARAQSPDIAPAASAPSAPSAVAAGGMPNRSPAGVDASRDLVFTGEMIIHPLEVEVDGLTAIVKTSASLLEGQPRKSYVWSVKLKDVDNNTLSEQFYPQQTFQLPKGGTPFHPSFSEAIQLQPGTYDVQVNLYGFRPGAKIPDFANGEKPKDVTPITAREKITVGL